MRPFAGDALAVAQPQEADLPPEDLVDLSLGWTETMNPRLFETREPPKSRDCSDPVLSDLSAT
jgi:hypothetical protein